MLDRVEHAQPGVGELRDSRITSTYCLSGRFSRSSFFTSMNAGPGSSISSSCSTW
jgi:hypothetical protein